MCMLAEAWVAIAIGVVLLLFGYRLTGPKPGESVIHDERMNQYKWLFRLGGLVAILGGIAKIFVPV